MTTKDTGPLDWRIAITDKAGRPTPEFQRRWATQRANNALIGTITLGSGVPTGTPDDGAEYVDASATPPILYIGNSGMWLRIGVFEFIQLSDVPNSYSGAGSKIVRVNSGATALEFDTISSVLDGLGSTRGDVIYRGASGWTVLAPGTSGNFLTTGGSGADPSWTAGGGGGGNSYEGFGNTPPAAASFTTVHQVGTTLNDSALSAGGLVLGQNGGSNTLELYGIAPPSTPWNLYSRFDSILSIQTAGTQAGLFVRNTSSGAIYATGLNSSAGIPILTVQAWNSPTSFNATLANSGILTISPRWFRINNDGTNLTFYYSNSGADWIQLFTVALVVFMGAVDQYGIYGDPAGNNGSISVIGSFGNTAPT